MSIGSRYKIVADYIHNQTEENWLKLVEKVGGEIPIETKPLSRERLQLLADDNGQITVHLAIPFGELACISTDGTYDGLNDWVDDHLFRNLEGIAVDYTYNAVAAYKDEVIFQFSCDASDLLDHLD